METNAGQVKVVHSYIALLEVQVLICRMLYNYLLAWLLHPTLVWRFQEAANTPMQGGDWTVCSIVPWHYQYSFTHEWGEACMEFTSCSRMLHSQPTDSTDIWTCNLCIQSPMHYPFSHLISTDKQTLMLVCLHIFIHICIQTYTYT